MMRTSSFRLIASSLAVLALAASCSLRTSAPPTTAEVGERLGRLAVPFVENAGQSDPRVAYYASTFSGTVFVTRQGEVVYALPASGQRATAGSREPGSGWTLAESFVDGHPTPVGAHTAATHVSVFAGSDPAHWRPDVASYADVDLGAVWPGISVALAAHGKQVEKVFTVEPGAAPDAIRIRVAGAESLAVAGDGGLVVHTGIGDVRLTPPVAYQEIAGTWRMLPAQYAISGDEYGFRVSGYDPTLPVVIDPLLAATYLGGSDIDQAITLAIGPAGDVYVAGVTASFNFPGTGPGAQQRFGGGSTDAFVARLDASLTAFQEATFLGGSGDDLALALAIAPTTGEVYVAGQTASTNFPGTSGGAQSGLGDVNLADPLDGFVARLNASLTSLEQATYLGGTGNRDAAVALAIAPATGTVYVAGVTNSVDFPGITGGAQSIPGGGQNDTFIARLNAGLTSLGQATFLGGIGEDRTIDMTIAPTTGDVYVAGRTSSPNLPGTNGGAQSALTQNQVQAGFVARLNASLTALRQATYLGGTGSNEADALAIAPATGDVYVAGSTSAADFPGTAGGAQSVIGGVGSTDTFVARLSADLTSLDQATYLGGGNREFTTAMRLTTSDVYVVGQTTSTNFPGTVGGAQSTPGGNADAFVARLSTDLTALHQATYLGGGSDDGAFDLAIAPTTGDVYIAGFTASTVFPGTAGGAQSAFGGTLDGFVARLSADLSSTPTTTSTSSSTTTTRPPTTTTSTSTTTTRPTTTTTSTSTTTTRPTTTTTSTSSSTTTTRPPTTTTSTSSSTTTTRPTTTTTTQPATTTTTTTTSSTTTAPSTTTTSSSTTTSIPGGTCPVRQGFWEKHPSAWPVTTLVLGSQTYTQSELLAVLRARRSSADASLLLARQLIAAKLNVANGSDPTTIGTTVADADRLLATLGGRLPYGVPPSSALGRSMISDRDVLDRYNAGRDTPTCVRSFH
jgi:hypothetical protein